MIFPTSQLRMHYASLQGQFCSPENAPFLKNHGRGHYVALQGQFCSPENYPFLKNHGRFFVVADTGIWHAFGAQPGVKAHMALSTPGPQ